MKMYRFTKVQQYVRKMLQLLLNKLSVLNLFFAHQLFVQEYFALRKRAQNMLTKY